MIKEMFESTNLTGTLEVLALTIEDEKLIEKLGSIFSNEGRIGLLFKGLHLVKNYQKNDRYKNSDDLS